MNSVASELTSKLGSKLLSGLGILGVAVGIGATVTKAIQSAMGAEAGLHAMKSTLQATGQEVEGNIKKFNDLAAAIAATTTVSKGQVKELIELGLKHGLTADAAARMSTNSLFLAKATGMDAKEALELLARGDERAFTALGRHSKEIQEATTKQGKLDAVNRLITQGQKESMAATETSEGKWAKLENTISGLYTKFGTMLLPVISKIIDGLSGFFDWVNQLCGAVSDFGSTVGGTFGNVGSNFSWLGDLWDTVVSGIKEGIEGLVFAFNNWSLIAENVGLNIAMGFINLWDRIRWFGEQVPIFFKWVWNNAGDIFKDWVNIQITILLNLAENFKRIWNAVLDWFAGKGFHVELKGLTEGFKSEIKKMPEFTKFQNSDMYKEMGKDLASNQEQLGKQYNKWQDSMKKNKPVKPEDAAKTVDDSMGLNKGDLTTKSKGGGSFSGLAESWKKAQEGIMKNGEERKAQEDRKKTREASERTAKATEKIANSKSYAVAH